MKFGVTICNMSNKDQDDTNYFNLRFEKSIDMLKSKALLSILKARNSEGAISGDEVTVDLDRTTGTVTFYLNGTELGEAFRDDQLISESGVHFSISFSKAGEQAKIV